MPAMKRYELIGELESVLRCVFSGDQDQFDLSPDDVQEVREQLNSVLDAVEDVRDVE